MPAEINLKLLVGTTGFEAAPISKKRKDVLDAIREELRKEDYLQIKKPVNVIKKSLD